MPEGQFDQQDPEGEDVALLIVFLYPPELKVRTPANTKHLMIGCRSTARTHLPKAHFLQWVDVGVSVGEKWEGRHSPRRLFAAVSYRSHVSHRPHCCCKRPLQLQRPQQLPRHTHQMSLKQYQLIGCI